MTPHAVFLVADGAVIFRRVETREFIERDGEAEDDERKRDGEIGKLDGCCFLQAVEVEFLRGERGYVLCVLCCFAENQQATEERADDGAERVEGLRQIQSAGCGVCRPKHRDIRIGRYLQGRDAGCEHDERGEKERERGHAGGGDEKQCTDAHGEESGDHGALVADPFDDFSCRDAEGCIRAKEDELYEHGFGVVEREDGLQMRDEDVIERCKKAPHEEERGDHRHGALVGFAGGIGCNRRAAYVCDCHAVFESLKVTQSDGACPYLI